MRLPNILTSTLFVMVIIVAIGLYYRGGNDIADGDIGLVIGVPAEHSLHRQYSTLPLPVVVRLVNRTDTTQALHADSPCKIFRYVVATPAGGFIQAAGQKTSCQETATSAQLAAGDTLEEVRQVPLDTSRYTPGTYKLHIRFWSHEAEAEFRLIAADTDN